MTTAIINSFINPPDQSQYNFKPGKTLVVEQLEGGHPRIRRDNLNASHYITCTYSCTPPQYTYLSGFFRERIQGFAQPFIAQLLIDIPYVLSYLCKLLEEPELVTQQGLLYVIQTKYAVIPNPIRSFTLLLNNSAGPIIVDAGSADYTGQLDDFIVGKTVSLRGTRQIVDGVDINLDGDYVMDSAPNAFTRHLLNAAVINPAWTALAGTTPKQYFPLSGAAVVQAT